MTFDTTTRLTHLAECAGCAAKFDQRSLAAVLAGLPSFADPNVLVGNASADDAAIYRISDDVALVLTVDFFPPIVDDPRTFGRIAATNALSDIYAMGATPLAALAITAFPDENVDPAVLHAILAGGIEAASQAGIAIVGGHTVKDSEPKYGLSVVGRVHPERHVRNDSGRAGDVLVLTKPLGTGILTTARRRDLIDDAALEPAIEAMTTLNRGASEAMLAAGASAATDVTGFGLLGHLHEMCAARLGARIDSSAVPLLARALDLARSGAVPGGTRTNYETARSRGVSFDAGVEDALRLLLCDAQTSGGLLIAIPPDRADHLTRELNARTIPHARIGTLTESPGIQILA